MATFLKTCDGNCDADACATDYPVCPVGYYCAFGAGGDAEDKETECLKGRCVNVDDSLDILKTGQYQYFWCSRCDPGYVIIQWKEEYKTKLGKSDCEFVTSSCPQICDPYTPNTGECTEKSECGNCEEAESNCTDSSGYITYPINCSGEQQLVCSSDYSFSGADIEEVESYRPKGVVDGDTPLKCCGCDINLCPGCGNPCAGSCAGGVACEVNQYCNTSTVPCGECVPIRG